MLTNIITKLTSDSRKEPQTSDIKAKYDSISGAFKEFNWEVLHGGTTVSFTLLRFRPPLSLSDTSKKERFRANYSFFLFCSFQRAGIHPARAHRRIIEMPNAYNMRINILTQLLTCLNNPPPTNFDFTPEIQLK